MQILLEVTSIVQMKLRHATRYTGLAVARLFATLSLDRNVPAATGDLLRFKHRHGYPKMETFTDREIETKFRMYREAASASAAYHVSWSNLERVRPS